MTREEAIEKLNALAWVQGGPDREEIIKAIEMAIESLSAEQKEEELAKDIARQMATIIENEQDMRVILKNASAEDEQGVGRYENAMQKLRDMPRYLNGVKKKQITKISANYTTEKPNDVVEQKNDVVVEPTDLISRADAIALLTKIVFDEPPYLDSETLCRLYAEEQINALPSADRPSGEWVKHNDISTIIVYYTCSECGEIESGTPPYCRKCGAKMGGDTR